VSAPARQVKSASDLLAANRFADERAVPFDFPNRDTGNQIYDPLGRATLPQKCLALRTEQGNVEQAIKTLAAIARLAWQAGEREAAGRLWGAVVGIRNASNLGTPRDEDGDAESITAELIRGSLDDAPIAAAYAEGRAFPLPDTARLASAILRKWLPPDAVPRPG